MSELKEGEIIQTKFEGEQMIISFSPSSLDRFMGCQLSHYYAKEACIVPVDKSEAMEKGSVFHRILEHHYNLIRQGKDDYKTIMEKVLASIRIEAVNSSDIEGVSIDEIIRVYQRYAIFYLSDPLIPVEVEAPFSYLIFENEHIKILLEGIIDLVMAAKGNELLVYDHKTSAKQNKYTLLSNQFRAYSLVTGIKTVMINEIGLQKEPVFRRVPLFYTESHWSDFKNVIIPGWIKRYLEAKRENHWLPNPSHCNFCSYKMLCESDPSTREFKISTFYKKAKAFDVFTGRKR